MTLRRVLVLGLARSGEAAGLALRARDIEVVGYDRNPEIDAERVGRLGAAGVEIQLGEEDATLLRGIDVVVKSPGVPGESSLVAGARAQDIPVWSEIELGVRLVPEPARRRHRHERQDDDDRAARRDLPRRRQAGRGGRQHRPAADVAGRADRRPTRG